MGSNHHLTSTGIDPRPEGVTWVFQGLGHRARVRLRLAVAALAAAVAGATALPATATAAATNPAGDAAVVVRMAPGAAGQVARSIDALGGSVERELGIIGGVAARVPAGAVDALARTPGVVDVTADGTLDVADHDDDAAGSGGSGSTLAAFNTSDAGSLHKVARYVDADDLWARGYTGSGVDVALLDTGVTPVGGLDGAGKVVNGPDLSFEAPHENLRHLDGYGHGTHLAGIIAGRDPGVAAGAEASTTGSFLGVAPGARVVNVKVADATGAADVSQVIAGIDWVVQHRQSNGLNIRVLNLSFATDGTQDRALDPLSYAVEQAWKAGIFVVVSAGNAGTSQPALLNPARNPFVVVAGASDNAGTEATGDDTVPAWSSRGNGTRNPDLVAPGQSIASLRVPGSFVDETFPAGQITGQPRLFRGSGTSQSAAVTSGVAALVLQARPWLTPDRLKAAMRAGARDLSAPAEADGRGLLDADAAEAAWTHPNTTQSHSASTGTGSLEASRGSHHVERDGYVLSGEQTAFGVSWSGPATASWSGGSWTGGSWTGGTWRGAAWTGGSWSGQSWNGVSWSGGSWSGGSWSGGQWSGGSWSGGQWSGGSWSGGQWSGGSWSGGQWSSAQWG